MKPIESIWYPSGLVQGDLLDINEASETGKKSVAAIYIEDIPCGISVDMVFEYGHYRKTVTWNKIRCGAVTVKSHNGILRAKQIKKKGEWYGEEGED